MLNIIHEGFLCKVRHILLPTIPGRSGGRSKPYRLHSEPVFVDVFCRIVRCPCSRDAKAYGFSHKDAAVRWMPGGGDRASWVPMRAIPYATPPSTTVVEVHIATVSERMQSAGCSINVGPGAVVSHGPQRMACHDGAKAQIVRAQRPSVRFQLLILWANPGYL